MNYSIYIKSGQIIKNINCAENQIDIQLSESEKYIIGNYPCEQYYIQDEIPISIPNPPSPYYVFNYTTKTWDEDYDLAANAQQIQRNKLLYESDWTQIPNNPLTSEQQTAWAVYRQELRDITLQPNYPFNVVWPTPPA